MGSSVSDISATAFRTVDPSETALKTATLSAHIVSPYELFSILHPENTDPFPVRTAAPTRKEEKGA